MILKNNLIGVPLIPESYKGAMKKAARKIIEENIKQINNTSINVRMIFFNEFNGKFPENDVNMFSFTSFIDIKKCDINKYSYSINVNPMILLNIFEYDRVSIEIDLPFSSLVTNISTEQLKEFCEQKDKYNIIKFSIINGRCIKEIIDIVTCSEDKVKETVKSKRTQIEELNTDHAHYWIDYEKIK